MQQERAYARSTPLDDRSCLSTREVALRAELARAAELEAGTRQIRDAQSKRAVSKSKACVIDVDLAKS